MKTAYLGIDTSNYTTSAAVWLLTEGRVLSQKQLLPVDANAKGLRQSDAVFAHVKQLADVIRRLCEQEDFSLRGVCASTVPRPVSGSYMPAFLVGKMAAETAAALLRVPFYTCSHQEGHIMAALYSANALFLRREPFYAFHVSGGTTECLRVTPTEGLFSIEKLAGTLDLNAGQLIDRVGVTLGLRFPCGAELDRMAQAYGRPLRAKPSMEGLNAHFSGAQNQCERLLSLGGSREETARYAIEYVCAAVDEMTARVMEAYGKLPVVYAGGVMSNSLRRDRLTKKYGGYFAEAAFSSDNAAGVALIGAIKDGVI